MCNGWYDIENTYTEYNGHWFLCKFHEVNAQKRFQILFEFTRNISQRTLLSFIFTLMSMSKIWAWTKNVSYTTMSCREKSLYYIRGCCKRNDKRTVLSLPVHWKIWAIENEINISFFNRNGLHLLKKKSNCYCRDMEDDSSL